MKSIFSLKSALPFEPAGSVNLGAVAVGYTTPAAYRLKLGNMANISGNAYQVRYKIQRTGGAAAVDLVLKLKRGDGTELWSTALNLAAGAETVGIEDLDLGTVSGSTPLFLEVEVTTADAGTTATLWADLVADTPTVIGGC